MTDHSSAAAAWILGILSAMWYATHPWAATGAAFGCCFFLAYPGATTTGQRWFLGFFSLGIGYACGVFFYGEGPPYSNKAMFVAATTAAVAAAVFTAWRFVIDTRGDLPPWVKTLIEILPFKRGAARDDS